MDFNFFSPIPQTVLDCIESSSAQVLGRKIRIHSKENGLPNLEHIKIAIFSVEENRNAVNSDYDMDFSNVRKSLYQLFPGNWDAEVADLGNIQSGETIDDTYFAVQSVLKFLIEKEIIPLIIGGSQDITYQNYRAYDDILPMVNIVNVDYKFDFGDASLPITNANYIGKIIVDQPYNLFNYTSVGYQTYFNSQEEIDLLDKLHFEAYRLGETTNDIKSVEPLLRDANIVTIDLNSVKSSEVSESQKFSPNGFTGSEMCAISRYAGISNKVSSFGIYEYKSAVNNTVTSMLLAQMIWYFIEGVNCRVKDDAFLNDANYQKYNVLIHKEELVFYKSLKTGRWWVEIPFLPNVNNKLKKHTLLPCTSNDYLDAVNAKMPERWYKAYSKNSY